MCINPSRWRNWSCGPAGPRRRLRQLPGPVGSPLLGDRGLALGSRAPPHLPRFSVDEGLTWSTHNFTSTSVFVDGLLSEPGDETLVMT